MPATTEPDTDEPETVETDPEADEPTTPDADEEEHQDHDDHQDVNRAARHGSSWALIA
ncbi:hypothetical protein ACFY2H_39935 [Streptomyces griseofuscus]|uniref:hypothetical protein n=1 Tax=Streptomyces griseofuscus TaxID=146922 RepID=UPI003677A23E